MEQTLGNVLRAARKSAGITVDDAVYLAKMPRAVVEALEAEDFGFFSSPLYARSFLQQYGEYVGADVEPWLDDFEPTTMIDGEALESFIDLSDPVAAAVTREKPKPNTSGSKWAPVWMILFTAGLLWAGIILYGYFESRFAPSAETAISNDEDGINTSSQEASNPTVTGEVEPAPALDEGESTAGAQPTLPRRAIVIPED